MERAGYIISGPKWQLSSSKRFDTQINAMNNKNLKNNKEILPQIEDVVLMCARQQIGFREQRDDNIQFCEPAKSNEGNFIAEYVS